MRLRVSRLKRRSLRIGSLRSILLLVAVSIAIALAGCADNADPWQTETTAAIQASADAKYYASDEPYKLGVEHFNRGNFGLAERYFRDAVEKAPRDASA